MDCLEWQSILAGARPWTAGAGFNREVLSRHGRHSRLICFQGIKMLLENHYQNAHVTRDIEQRSEEHTSELQSLMRISYAVFCLKKKKKNTSNEKNSHTHEHT